MQSLGTRLNRQASSFQWHLVVCMHMYASKQSGGINSGLLKWCKRPLVNRCGRNHRPLSISVTIPTYMLKNNLWRCTQACYSDVQDTIFRYELVTLWGQDEDLGNHIRARRTQKWQDTDVNQGAKTHTLKCNNLKIIDWTKRRNPPQSHNGFKKKCFTTASKTILGKQGTLV